ncbi:trypsin-like peptidase domain-containing protein [Pseudohongiella sp. O18]|uniref:trypsin-like peptidase domain-containing protein n=1 Tax=Pseudohongiella sp. O18 TaxID=2904248 RepID=UPI001F3749A8|nr:trypsin-like peptidase domain-containing protein [Pseudohongiella sp. O18]
MPYFNANSARSIYIEMYFNDKKLATGTGFFCESNVGSILFTNRHNVTGRDSFTGQPLSDTCGTPNKLRFTCLSPRGPIVQQVDLYEDEEMTEPVWAEHPDLGEKVDVVGLIVEKFKGKFPHYVVPFKDWNRWDVGSQVHVIGFPFSLSADGFAIWATGYIASEPDVDYGGLPVFLIDCRTRPGQSGSQVIAQFKPGDTVEKDGKLYQAQAHMTHFLGIYSGRIHKDSDLGRVWKPSVVRDIIDYAERHLTNK